MSTHVVWHNHTVSKTDREQLKGHKPCLIWFTGLSGSGKSTLANALEARLYARKVHSYVLDGDNVRHGLSKDLGFSDADRTENIRRISEVGKLFVDAGLIVMTAFISPFEADRSIARQLLPIGEFMEVFVDCPLPVCEARDTKGIYQKARRGEIKQFTGIDSPYETPVSPELVVKTAESSIDACVDQIMAYLTQKEILS